MGDIKLDFNNCNINIEKMFDIHDNQNVNIINNEPDFKPIGTTCMNTSDYEHLKDYHDNDDLDYYLSEDHWNFHVNTILYKNLLVFHDGYELGAFLDVKGNYVTQPIKDYTLLYGRLINEAYRLCNNVLSTPVPETKVARFAKQAATWKFRDLNDQDGNPLKIVPSVIELIESYHILGMANAILTLSNDQNDSVNRFLIALSVYKDSGLFFRGNIHCFQPYNELYEAFIYATIVDGSYLRPGYDNKKRNEYLRNNIPWYENIVAKSANKKTNTAKSKSKVERKPSDKPLTLKYYKHGNKGLHEKQHYRVMLVFRKFNEWKWVDANTKADDFEALFDGEPRHCNITWTGNTTILTILLQELLRQNYIEKQTGCSAKSLVKKQFGLTANSDRTRLDNDAVNKINIILYILDPNNPIPERKERNSDERYDTSDTTLKLLGEKLRSTKGI